MPDQHPKIAPAEMAALNAIAKSIVDPGRGLPTPVFEFALQIVPMINVDLLIMDFDARILLSWRDDKFAAGWHIPGGIIRKSEQIGTRLQLTSLNELSVAIEHSESPVAIAQLFGDRGHFISLLYLCRMIGDPEAQFCPENKKPKGGDLRWFERLPSSLYPSQTVYAEVIRRIQDGEYPTTPEVLCLNISEQRAERPET